MSQRDIARTGSPLIAPPRLLFLPQMHQSIHDIFVRLETRVGHVCNRREEDVEKEGREHESLTKALVHNESPRTHPVVEPHACSHAIMELMNDRDNILWHAKTGECCPEADSVNGIVRFGKVDKAYIRRNSSLSRQLLYYSGRIKNIISVVERFETIMFLQQDPHGLTVVSSLRRRAMILSSILPACVTSEIPLYLPHSNGILPILIFVEYHCDGIIPLLRHLSPF